MCVSMLDSHRACISSCVNAGLPQSLNILLCECVFPCWAPTELVHPRVNVCFHAGLPQSLSVIRLYEKIGFELVGLFKCIKRRCVLRMVGKAASLSIPAIEKEQSPNFAEDRGTSRRFLGEDRSFLSAAEVRDVRSPTHDDHLVFYTLSSTAFKRSAEEHATNVGCQAADRLYDRMVSDYNYMRRAAEFSTDCIRSSRHVCR